jgi:threonine dehydratase
MRWIAGVDGCKAGWIAVIAELEARADPRIIIVSRFAELLALPEQPEMIAVDMPIGLPDQINGAGRGPEQAVRARLGPRKSSVFSIPARTAVYAPDYAEACRLAALHSQPPKKISKQGYFLFPKIIEIDGLLRATPSLCAQVREVHPELAFALMKGAPLTEPKKLKGAVHLAGMAERRALLHAQGWPESLVMAKAPRGAGADDLLDALACLTVARHMAHGRGQPFPDPPLRDNHGIPIAIWGFNPAKLD